jgi:hypothetical protein
MMPSLPTPAIILLTKHTILHQMRGQCVANLASVPLIVGTEPMQYEVVGWVVPPV